MKDKGKNIRLRNPVCELEQAADNRQVELSRVKHNILLERLSVTIVPWQLLELRNVCVQKLQQLRAGRLCALHIPACQNDRQAIALTRCQKAGVYVYVLPCKALRLCIGWPGVA